MRFGLMRKERLLTEATTKPLGLCQVRSKTEQPCTHQAVVKIHGMPFCGPCARDQEAYFAMGELTQEARGERRRAPQEESNRTLQEAMWQLFVQEEMRGLELRKEGQREGTLNRMRGATGAVT